MQVLYYSTEIFAAAGIKHGDIATVVAGVTLVTFSVLAVSVTSYKTVQVSAILCHVIDFFQVFLIETVGRRTLMLYGVGGMAIFYTILTSMFCFEV